MAKTPVGHSPGTITWSAAPRVTEVAYVMNKMAFPGSGMVVWPIAAALVERSYDIVNR